MSWTPFNCTRMPLFPDWRGVNWRSLSDSKSTPANWINCKVAVELSALNEWINWLNHSNCCQCHCVDVPHRRLTDIELHGMNKADRILCCLVVCIWVTEVTVVTHSTINRNHNRTGHRLEEVFKEHKHTIFRCIIIPIESKVGTRTIGTEADGDGQLAVGEEEKSIIDSSEAVVRRVLPLLLFY